MFKPTALAALGLGFLLANPLAAVCGAGGGSSGSGPGLSNRGNSDSSDDATESAFQMAFTEFSDSEKAQPPAHIRVHGPWQVNDTVIAETTRAVPFVAAPDWRGYRDRASLATAIEQQGQPRLVVVDELGNEIIEISGAAASDRRLMRALRDLDGLIATALERTEQAVAQAEEQLARGRDQEAALAVLRHAARLQGHEVGAVASGLLQAYAPEAPAAGEAEVLANRE